MAASEFEDVEVEYIEVDRTEEIEFFDDYVSKTKHVHEEKGESNSL